MNSNNSSSNKTSEKQFDVDAAIRNHFEQGAVAHEYSFGFVLQLLRQAQASLKRQPALIELKGRVTVCGDLHGQYADLLQIFEKCGWPFSTRYLFLGDYVDRGKHSLETLCLLLLCQIKFPENVFLLRGNHEIRSVNKSYGFFTELRIRYPKNEECMAVFEAVSRVYSLMPLAALILEKILCVHGGIAPGLNSIDDLKELKKGVEEPSGLLEDILWSDPCGGSGFTKNNDRGCSFFFGNDVLAETCKRLGVSLIVRGHQVVQEGFEFSNNHKVLTLFSAPGYADHVYNKGAVMQIDAEKVITFKQFYQRKMTRVSKLYNVAHTE